MSITKSNNPHNFFHYLATSLRILVKNLVIASVWAALGGVGYLVWEMRKTPYDLLIGIPLMLISVGLILNSLSSLVLSVFSPKYNRGMCKFCSKEV